MQRNPPQGAPVNKHQLETFAHLAKTLSFAETARALYVTQPAVSQQIARLEDEMGVRLVDRSGRRVELTAAGKLFAADCDDILSRLDGAIARARDQDVRFTGSLRVGCGNFAAISRLDKILERFTKRMPNVHLYIAHDGAVETWSAFAQGSLDTAFSARRADAPAGTAFTKLADGGFVCVMPGNRLAEKPSVSLAELAGESLIFLEDSCCPPEMRDAQMQILHRCPGCAVYYSGSALVSATMIKAGIGAAVMPDFAQPVFEGVSTATVPELGRVELGLYWREGSAPARELARCAEEVFG